jgi:hypothetical protein
MYKVINEYYTYPVRATVSVMLPDEPQRFPTVVFCNHNPVSCAHLFRVSEDYPAVWNASGCSIGNIVFGYVKNVTMDYNVRFGFPIPGEFITTNARGSSPLVDFWAYQSLDSSEILAMLQREK